MKKLKPVKLLLIEDTIDHWIMIRSALQQAWPAAKPVHAATAQQTLALLAEWLVEEWELPKLIVLDLYLPTSEAGWALLEQIKTMPAAIARIPLLILSASEQLADINQAYQLGASSYLVKPTSFPEWVSFIEGLREYWVETATLPPIKYSS